MKSSTIVRLGFILAALNAGSILKADSQPMQKLTALWNGSRHLDLFATDRSGRVVSSWWEPGCGWQAWFPIHAESGKAAGAQPVTAVWSNPQHLDLFMTDSQGRVLSTWWEGAKGWQAWFPIHAVKGKAAAGQPVTEVRSNPQ